MGESSSYGSTDRFDRIITQKKKWIHVLVAWGLSAQSELSGRGAIGGVSHGAFAPTSCGLSWRGKMKGILECSDSTPLFSFVAFVVRLNVSPNGSYEASYYLGRTPIEFRTKDIVYT